MYETQAKGLESRVEDRFDPVAKLRNSYRKQTMQPCRIYQVGPDGLVYSTKTTSRDLDTRLSRKY